MRTKKKQVWQIVCLGALVIFCVGFGLFRFVLSRIYMEQPIIPQETGVMIQYVGPYSVYSGAAMPRSYFSYYDPSGSLLGIYKTEEISSGPCVAYGDDASFYFFRDHTVSADSRTSTTLRSSDATQLSYPVFSPNEVGYIEEMELSYALLNVGILPESDSYINIIRFVSKEESYDVVVPFYLTDISYDAFSRKLIGLVSPLTWRGDAQSFDRYYIVIEYDAESGRFQANDDLHSLSSPDSDPGMIISSLGSGTGVTWSSRVSYSGTKLFEYLFVKDNKLYVVCNTLQNGSNRARLYLDVYDLRDDTLLSQEVLVESYDAGRLGHGVIGGISSSPARERNEKLYVFLSSNQVVAISDEDNMQMIEMPFVFEDALRFNHLSDTDPRTDFIGSLVEVGKDGEIYVLNAYPNEILRIHRLNEDGTYSLYWEGEFPATILPGSTAVGFVIMDRTEKIDEEK